MTNQVYSPSRNKASVSEPGSIAAFRRLLNYLILNTSFNNNIGLLYGKAGTVQFVCYAEGVPGLTVSNDLAFSLLDELLVQINHNTPFYFGNGIAGVGVLLEHLGRNGFLSQEDINELLEDCEPHLFSMVYQAKLKTADIASGVSGMGLYFLHRLQGNNGLSLLQELRMKESIIACVDQISNITSRPATDNPDISLFTGLSGAVLFLVGVSRTGLYEPFTSQLISRIRNTLFTHLTTHEFSWQQLQAWFALFYSHYIITDNITDALKPSFNIFLQKAADQSANISFHETAFASLWLRLIFHKTQLSASIPLSNQLREQLLQQMNESTLPSLWPYNHSTRSVPCGLINGVCATALPLLSIETGDYRWLSAFGIDNIQPYE